MFILPFLPYIGPIMSAIGMFTDAAPEPTSAGAMGGLAATVAVTRVLKPYIGKLVAWTDTRYDNILWDWITTGLGIAVKIAAALGGRRAKAAGTQSSKW